MFCINDLDLEFKDKELLIWSEQVCKEK